MFMELHSSFATLFCHSKPGQKYQTVGSEDLRLYKILSIEKSTHGHTIIITNLEPDGKYLLTTGDDN
ncbi:hypothetical protein CS542_05660 [Pedobacter sp. IW39]|nr:hypothetical protein CS542_05660 [Pedobacter sp. IW39]